MGRREVANEMNGVSKTARELEGRLDFLLLPYGKIWEERDKQKKRLFSKKDLELTVSEDPQPFLMANNAKIKEGFLSKSHSRHFWEIVVRWWNQRYNYKILH